MLYAGSRKAVPSSRYGSILDVMEAMGWTFDDYLAQPADMIDELHVKLHKRALAEAKQTKSG